MTVPLITLFVGPSPNRNTQDATAFTLSSISWLDYQLIQIVDTNTSITEINKSAVQINIDSTSTALNAALSNTSAVTSESNANFKGRWSDATGAATVPASYSNNGQTWQLLQNIADITADEPVTGATNWQIINDVNMANVRQSKISNPKVRVLVDNDPASILRKGTALSVTRNSTAQYKDIYGIVRTALKDQLRPEKEGFLREPAGINLALRNVEFNDAVWAKIGATILTDDGTAPDNNVTADTLQLSASTTTRIQQDITLSSDTTYTFSVYIKAKSGDADIKLGITDDVSGTQFGPTITATTEWVRYELTVTTGSGITTSSVTMRNAGALAGDFFIWGAQVEENNFATSLMLSDASVGTRASDELKIEVNGNFLSSAEGDHTQIIKYKLLGDTGGLQRIYATRGLPSSNERFNAVSNASTGIVHYRDGSSQQAASPSGVIGDGHTLVLVTKSGVITAFMDNVAGASVAITPDTVIDLTTEFHLGSDDSESLPMSGHFSLFEIHDIAFNLDEIKLIGGQ